MFLYWFRSNYQLSTILITIFNLPPALKLKIEIFESIILPVFLYGFETRPLDSDVGA